jgi:CoA:oxalate CoA-transferase
MKPLDGLLVLDLTQFMSGPLCTMILSDLGAEVIKFERPPVGDTSRYSPPGKSGASSYYVSLNRGKKSVLLNLKDATQKAAFMEIVRKADILVENFKPGTMAKYGVGYDDLKKLNPRLVYTAISGYGQTGPLHERGALDLIIQAASGLMSITGELNGEPLKTGTSFSDAASGLFATIGTLAAVRRAQATGEGDYIDVAMLDSTFALLENAVARYCLTRIVPKPLGNRHPSAAPFQSFDTKNGKVFVCSISDENWQSLARGIKRPDLAEDPRFKTMLLRQQNIDALSALVQDELKSWAAEDLMAAMDRAGIVSGQINTLDKVVEDPQILARKMLMSVSYPGAEPMKTAASPIKMHSIPEEVESYCAGLGEDTIDVMAGYGGLKREAAEELYREIFEKVKEVIAERAIV